jgi:hypothetical protein
MAAASSSGMAAASSSGMVAASSSGMVAASSSGMVPGPFAGLKFRDLPQKYLKRNIELNLYNNIAGGDLSLKDPSVECVDTIAYYNHSFLLIVHPSHYYLSERDSLKRFQIVNIKIPKSVVDNRDMWDF